jgi:hypothetical protein
MVVVPPPKPISGVEVGARLFVLEALVIALAKQAPSLPPDLKDRIRKTVASFNRPELIVYTDAYIEEISAELAIIDQPPQAGRK